MNGKISTLFIVCLASFQIGAFRARAQSVPGGPVQVNNAGGLQGGKVPASAFPILAPNGSAAAPSYSFLNDGAMGVWRGDPFSIGLLGLTLNGGTNAVIYMNGTTGTVIANNMYMYDVAGAQLHTIWTASSATAIFDEVASGGAPSAGRSFLRADPTLHALTVANNTGSPFAVVNGTGAVNQILIYDTLAAQGAVKGDSKLTWDGAFLGVNGDVRYTEKTAPAVTVSTSKLYADSTAHALELSNNADSFDIVARSVTGYSSSQTSSSTAYVDVLSVSLPASAKYHCAVDGVFRESVAADGAKVRVNPGATSVASDAIHGELYDGDSLLGGGVLNTTGSGFDSASAGTIVELADTSVTAGHFVWSYNVSTSAAMTWKLQAAQQAHTTGTLTIEPGVTVVCSRL